MAERETDAAVKLTMLTIAAEYEQLAERLTEEWGRGRYSPYLRAGYDMLLERNKRYPEAPRRSHRGAHAQAAGLVLCRVSR